MLTPSTEQSILITKTVSYYGKDIPVEKLCKNSDKKLQVRCPICKKVRWVYAKIYFNSKNTICHVCGLSQRKKHLNVGDTYNRWTVLGRSAQVGLSKCLCTCGTVREVTNTSLLKGLSKSCGCLNSEQLQNRRKYLKVDTRYGRLVVKGHAGIVGYSVCKCDCGKVIDVANTRLKARKTRSCGCLHTEIFKLCKKLKGKHHPNWKGGISGQRHKLMSTTVYKTWRTSVYERDNYTCQKCKQVGYELRAHHIESYAEHENKRCDVNNGVTLCNQCHLKFHKTHGRKNINRKQLDRFLLTA